MLRKISQNCYFIWIKNQKVAPIWYFSSEIPNLCFGFLVRSFGIFPSNLVFSQPIWYFSSQSGIFSPNLVFFQKIWYSIKWNGVHTPHLDIAVRNFEQAPLAPVEPAASVSGIKISAADSTTTTTTRCIAYVFPSHAVLLGHSQYLQRLPPRLDPFHLRQRAMMSKPCVLAGTRLIRRMVCRFITTKPPGSRRGAKSSGGRRHGTHERTVRSTSSTRSCWSGMDSTKKKDRLMRKEC